MVLALIPQHAEKIRPPRTLELPFPLGRPFGVPEDAEFQHRVLTAALDMLQESSGVAVQSFDEEALERQPSDVEWSAPELLNSDAPNPSVVTRARAEVSALQALYAQHGIDHPTTVGVSGMGVSEAIEFCASFLRGVKPAANESRALAQQLKCAVEDIKAFYNEAACAQAAKPTIAELENWYWGVTAAGELVRQVRLVLADHENKILKLTGNLLLVPGSQVFRDLPADSAK